MATERAAAGGIAAVEEDIRQVVGVMEGRTEGPGTTQITAEYP